MTVVEFKNILQLTNTSLLALLLAKNVPPVQIPPGINSSIFSHKASLSIRPNIGASDAERIPQHAPETILVLIAQIVDKML